MSIGPIAARHPALDELEQARASWPVAARKRGNVEMIVLRPQPTQRTCPERVELHLEHGMVGDHWALGKRIPTSQITLMDVRVARAIGSRADWPLAGDNFIVDLDLHSDLLPEGSIVRIGEARLEVTREPHLGCRKFSDRFGSAAMAWVNDKALRPLRLRGINTRIVTPGVVKLGDDVAAE